MPDLKNCPCCGSDTVRYRDERGGRSVECIYCGLGTAIYRMGVAKHEVVGKWNRRVLPEVDDLASLVRQLAHALKKHSPDSNLAERAVGYLQRKDLQGSPYRKKR